MTTIVRVKRLRGDDPVEALVLSCKRKKTEDSGANQDFFKKIFNFSGTVDDKDDKVATSTVQSFNKASKYSNLVKSHTPEIRLKWRQEQRERSENSRFTLLSCLRSGNGVAGAKVGAATDSEENFTIVDVSKDFNEKAIEHETWEDSFVYDLYSIQESNSDFNDLYMENLLSIQPLETHLDYQNGRDCYEEEDPDEDDSNDENNWRNDYPDTESSTDEDEYGDKLAKQLKGFHLDEYDLSSDSGEEEYLNYEDGEHYHYYEAEGFAWKRYAKYKANALKQMMEESVESGSEAEESEERFQDCEVLSCDGDSDQIGSPGGLH